MNYTSYYALNLTTVEGIFLGNFSYNINLHLHVYGLEKSFNNFVKLGFLQNFMLLAISMQQSSFFVRYVYGNLDQLENILYKMYISSPLSTISIIDFGAS